MATAVPESYPTDNLLEPAALLGEALDALLEITGAEAGWAGLPGRDGRLTFPAQRGDFPASWLALQQGVAPVWGFAVHDTPALFNDLPNLGNPPLRCLLSCPVAGAGQLVLANKPAGFTPHDLAAVQATAHLLGKRLACPAPPRAAWQALRAALDRVGEGVLVFDEAGTLVFANAAWARWTGYRGDELAPGRPPFPFWVSHKELLAGPASAAAWTRAAPDQASKQVSYLPFRHRNGGTFWCQVETVLEAVDGKAVTVATLRRLPASPAGADVGSAGSVFAFQSLVEALPFAAVLTDRYGQVLWANATFYQDVAPPAKVLGQPLGAAFASAAAAALEQLTRDRTANGVGRRGRLILERAGARGHGRDLVAHWLAVPLADGPGFLFGLAEDWETLWPPDDVATAWHQTAARPGADQLALLVRSDGVAFWDERWEKLTGLAVRDVAGAPSDLVLDWLLPRQQDRELVADVLHHSVRGSTQAVLEFAVPGGSLPLLCTFLSVTPDKGESGMLLLASQPETSSAELPAVQRFVQPFARGLGHLLNHYLSVPLGVAEAALDRNDLPADIAAAFGQIQDHCMRANRLLVALEDLAATMPGEPPCLTLSAVVREFLGDLAAETPEPDYELVAELRDHGATVRGSPRLLKAVLRHLLTNAVQAIEHRARRRIDVRVWCTDTEVCCSIHDSGEGLPTSDWTAVLVPFFSTKGPFARDAGQAAVEAAGLGLTVSQHLVALHGGRLELRSSPGEGVTATILLPRASAVADEGVIARGARMAKREEVPG